MEPSNLSSNVLCKQCKQPVLDLRELRSHYWRKHRPQAIPLWNDLNQLGVKAESFNEVAGEGMIGHEDGSPLSRDPLRKHDLEGDLSLEEIVELFREVA